MAINELETSIQLLRFRDRVRFLLQFNGDNSFRKNFPNSSGDKRVRDFDKRDSQLLRFRDRELKINI